MRMCPIVRALPFVASLALVVALPLPGSRPSARSAASGPLGARPALQGAAHLPLGFEVNRGQFDRRVRFVARSGASTLFLTSNSATFSLATGDTMRPAVQLRMAGSTHIAPRGVATLPGTVNYFIGRHRWTNIPTYSRVVYPNIYPHTDLVYYGSGGHLEYDWVLKPGASPAAIHLQIAGTTSAQVDGHGNLILGGHGAVLREGPPVAYSARPDQYSDTNGHRAPDGYSNTLLHASVNRYRDE